MTSLALNAFALGTVALGLLGPIDAGAQTRRALLIGIDKYNAPAPAAWRSAVQREVSAWRTRSQATSSSFRAAGDPVTGLEGKRDITTLDGAVNDATAMQSLLVSRFQFPLNNTRLLTDGAATRDGILSALRTLVNEAKAGDMVVVYYAGHGAQRVNSLLNRPGKLNHLEETLVPVDATVGQFDLRSVDINPLFDQMLQKGATLTLIFDSCHSGSVTRGGPGPSGKLRLSGVDTRDALDATIPSLPDQKGALVMSASLDHQFAKEYRDPATEESHGAFTWALLRALRRMPNAPASRVFAQVRAVLAENDLDQVPVLRMTTGKDRPLFSRTTAAASDSVFVAVQRVSGDTVQLMGGSALSIGPDTRLRFADPERKRGVVEARVTEVRGPATSRAVVTAGRASSLAAGDLLAITQWSMADVPLLNAWIPPTIEPASLANALRELAPLRNSTAVEWVTDPTAVPDDTRPLYWVRWDGRSWSVVAPSSEATPVTSPSVAAVEAAIASSERRYAERAASTARASGAASDTRRTPRVFVIVPPTAELRREIAIGSGSANPAVALVTDVARAEVLLAGRLERDGTVSRAWIRPNGREGDTPTSSFPVRTSWFPTGPEPAAQADSLERSALTLARVNGWSKLEPPPGPRSFPYRLVMRNRATGAVLTAGRTREGEIYDLLLRRDTAEGKERVRPHYVYVLGIDSWGNGSLLWSSANQVPPADAGPGSAPAEFRLTVPSDTIDIRCPFGTDSFLMLASQEPVDEQVFDFQGVRSRGGGGTRGAEPPLTALLRGTSAATRGGGSNRKVVVPTTWSLDRLVLQSVGADGTSNNKQCSP